MLVDRDRVGLSDIPNTLKEVYDREECLELFVKSHILFPPSILAEILLKF